MTGRSKLLGAAALTAMMLGGPIWPSPSASAYPYGWHYHPAHAWHYHHWQYHAWHYHHWHHPYAWYHPYWHHHYYVGYWGYPHYYYYGPPPLLSALAAIALAPAALLAPRYYYYGPGPYW